MITPIITNHHENAIMRKTLLARQIDILHINEINYVTKWGMATLLFLLVTVINLCAQHELFIKGATLKIEEGTTIHVDGDFHIDNNGSSASDKGQLLNDGTIQLRGNFVFEADNIEQSTDINSGEGIVRFKNYDAGWNSITALENKAQRIIIENGADAEGVAAFNTIEIENEDQDEIGTDGNYVDILFNGTGNATVEVKGQLIFKNESRFITENANNGSKNDGSDYACELYISNTAADAISFNGFYNLNPIDYRAQAGSTTRYVEGVLSRAVTGTDDYYFPIGLTPGYVGGDGMAAFNLEVTGAGGQKIKAYVNSDDVTALSSSTIYTDVGEDPGAGIDNFSDCIGMPDGIYDRIILNQPLSHEWQIDNQDATDFNYNIEFYPGAGLNNTANNSTNLYSCGSNDFVIRYIAKDGEFYERTTGVLLNPQTAPTPFNNAGTETGYLYDPPSSIMEGNKLNSLSSFSTFRIHSAANNATVLPVELIYVKAESVNNSYIKVDWATAAEINNDFFEIQRSTDAVHWTKIGIVEGHGNSNQLQNYKYEDFQIQSDVIYYYRLKQVDFDGSYEYSEIVNASIHLTVGDFVFGEVFPNPIMQGNNTSLLVSSPIQQNFYYAVYNINGQIMKNKESFQISPGTSQNVSLLVNTIPAGNYIISIWNEQQIFHKKLTVIN